MKYVMLFLTLFFSTTSYLYAQKKPVISVLIIDGFSNHDWKQTTAITKMILEKTDRFSITVSTVPADSSDRSVWKPDFQKYDVVIQNTNNIHDTSLRWPVLAEQALEEYVKAGGGLYILHSGNNAFPHWREYDKMIGLGWRSRTSGYALEIDAAKKILRIPPNEGNDTGHGDRFNAVIQVLNQHPINKDYPEQWQTANTEVYNYPRGPAENMMVLSYAFDSTATQKNWPVEWVIQSAITDPVFRIQPPGLSHSHCQSPGLFSEISTVLKRQIL